jgi:hypothetical protein
MFRTYTITSKEFISSQKKREDQPLKKMKIVRTATQDKRHLQKEIKIMRNKYNLEKTSQKSSSFDVT